MKPFYFLAIAFTATLTIYLFAPKETFIRHDCTLTEGFCSVSQDNIVLTFKISPTPLKSQQAVSYEVTVTGINPKSAVIHLIGKSMHMEEDYIKLEKSQIGHYVAKRIFPTCSEKKMTWKAVVLLQEDNYYVKTIFDLQVITK